MRDMLADKGADLGVVAITAVVPGVMLAVKSWLAYQ